MANSLQHFRKEQLIVNRSQAARVLRSFFPDQPASEAALTDEDMGFAQALLVEAVDSSREMSYVQVLFEKAAYRVPTDSSFVKDLARPCASKRQRIGFVMQRREICQIPKSTKWSL